MVCHCYQYTNSFFLWLSLSNWLILGWVIKHIWESWKDLYSISYIKQLLHAFGWLFSTELCLPYHFLWCFLQHISQRNKIHYMQVAFLYSSCRDIFLWNHPTMVDLPEKSHRAPQQTHATWYNSSLPRCCRRKGLGLIACAQQVGNTHTKHKNNWWAYIPSWPS